MEAKTKRIRYHNITFLQMLLLANLTFKSKAAIPSNDHETNASAVKTFKNTVAKRCGTVTKSVGKD